MPKLRLDKIIADHLSCTRNRAAEIIKNGRVSVGGAAVVSRAELVDPSADNITLDKEPVKYRAFRYFMLNKPRGYLSATTDKRERTVLDLLDIEHLRLGLFPAGRLDKDAEGLLLLTNDGALAHKIMSPGSKIGKRYFAEYHGDITSEDIIAFSEGMVLADGSKCLPAVIEPVSGGAIVTLFEGKYHQVKRMMAAIGKPVKRLIRISIGGLELDSNLAPGQYRELEEEVFHIFNDLETKKHKITK